MFFYIFSPSFFKTSRRLLSFLPWLFFFPSLSGVAGSIEPGWDTSGTDQQAQAIGAVRALKEREDCDSSPAESSLLLAQEAIEVADHQRKQNFMCKVKNVVQAANRAAERDRNFMLSYLKKRENSEEISEEDHIRMTEKLMAYRLLRKDNLKEYYFPVTRYSPPSEVKRKIRKAAEKFVRESGPPSHCFFLDGDLVRKEKLDSPSCRERISLKAQSVPPPLVVAQSVLESGWGASSLAERHSNILGLQYLFSDPSSMPEYKNCRRAEGDVRRCLIMFDEGYEGSIFDYFSRFNGTHYPGYQNYRQARLDIHERAGDSCQKSVALADHIGFYAEKPDYIPEIQSMIRHICPLLKECGNETIMAQSALF